MPSGLVKTIFSLLVAADPALAFQAPAVESAAIRAADVPALDRPSSEVIDVEDVPAVLRGAAERDDFVRLGWHVEFPEALGEPLPIDTGVSHAGRIVPRVVSRSTLEALHGELSTQIMSMAMDPPLATPRLDIYPRNTLMPGDAVAAANLTLPNIGSESLDAYDSLATLEDEVQSEARRMAQMAEFGFDGPANAQVNRVAHLEDLLAKIVQASPDSPAASSPAQVPAMQAPEMVPVVGSSVVPALVRSYPATEILAAPAPCSPCSEITGCTTVVQCP